jgi:YesN/AraC family two-component response regulator
VRRVLEQQGFTLIEARNGEEGLEIARHHSTPIDLLITDVVLPLMDGFELSRQLALIHPATKVLFVSGYAGESVAVRGGLKESGQQFLLKPFTRQQLSQKIQEILADQAGPGSSASGKTP